MLCYWFSWGSKVHAVDHISDLNEIFQQDNPLAKKKKVINKKKTISAQAINSVLRC